MRRLLKITAGGAFVLLGLAGIAVQNARAQIRYEGGWVTTPAYGDTNHPSHAPRFDYYPPMRFAGLYGAFPSPVVSSGYPGYTGVYRSNYFGAESDSAPLASAPAAAPLYGIPPTALPWNQVNFLGYDEPPRAPRDPPVGVPAKYSLEATVLPREGPAPDPNRVVLVFHLPEEAALWVEGRLTNARGRTRYFESPPLTPGKKYHYTVSAAWFEEGRLVGQFKDITVRAGQAQGIYLALSPAASAQRKLEAQVEANLAKLHPEDQKVARLQRICVVMDGHRLGEQGVPVKVLVNGRRVFLCDPACVPKALADPKQTCAKALELRAKNTTELPAK